MASTETRTRLLLLWAAKANSKWQIVRMFLELCYICDLRLTQQLLGAPEQEKTARITRRADLSDRFH